MSWETFPGSVSFWVEPRSFMRRAKNRKTPWVNFHKNITPLNCNRRRYRHNLYCATALRKQRLSFSVSKVQTQSHRAFPRFDIINPSSSSDTCAFLMYDQSGQMSVTSDCTVRHPSDGAGYDGLSRPSVSDRCQTGRGTPGGSVGRQLWRSTDTASPPAASGRAGPEATLGEPSPPPPPPPPSSSCCP